MKRAFISAAMFLGLMTFVAGWGVNPGYADLSNDLNGSWTIDLEDMMSQMPEFKDLTAEQKEEVKKQMAEAMKEVQFTFDAEKKTMTSVLGPDVKETAEFTVKSQEGDTITITCEGQDSAIKFINKDTISMDIPNMPGGQRIVLTRVK